jgi:ribosomal silencing factor RsfS
MKKIIKWMLTILCVVTPFLLLLSLTGIFGVAYNRIGFSRMCYYFPWALIIAIILAAAVSIVAIKNKQGDDPWGINLFEMQWWAKLIVLAIIAALYFYDWKSDMEYTKEKQASAQIQTDGTDTTSVQKQPLVFDTTKNNTLFDQQHNQPIALDQNDSSGVIYQALIESMRRKKDSLIQAIASEKRAVDVVKENNKKKQKQKDDFCRITKEEKKQIDSLAASLAEIKREKSKIAIAQKADCDCSSGVVVIVNGKKQ